MQTRAETLPLVLRKLNWPERCYRIDVCSVEEDVQGLFLRWNERWDEWLADWRPCRVIVDFTSGTKPMSAAAFALAISRGAELVSYVVGERDAGGRVVRSSDVRSVSPDLVMAHRQLRLAREHFHAGGYASARDIAGHHVNLESNPNEHLRSIALSLKFVGGAYEAWDRFDYKTANQTFRESKRYWAEWSWVESGERLQRNHELVVAVRKDKEGLGPALCADLLGSVRRCMRRGEWDNAVVRLYRACELVAQLKLWRDHQQKTNNIDPAELPAAIRGEYEDRQARSPDRRVRLGLRDAYTLLEQLGDPVGREFRQRYGDTEGTGELHNLLNARNDSLLAHGTRPIQEGESRKLEAHVAELARIADPSIIDEWLPKAEPVIIREF